MSNTAQIRDAGVWSPLASRLFALVFATNLATQVAVFMNGTGAAWSMTELTDSPSVVAGLQVALAVPTFVLALIAGALADVASRKRIIVWSQSALALIAGVFAIMEFTGTHTPWTILGLTAALGAATAISAPSWLAVIPGLVSREQLAPAMTLSSAGISVAMAVGPALAGFLIAATEPGAVFATNAAVFVLVVVALRGWKPEATSGLPTEHLSSAIRVGLQYFWYDSPLKVVIGNVIPFALGSTALMALLPALARFELNSGPAVFGLLAGAGGIGAFLALLAMPTVRRRLSPDAIVLAAMLTQAGVFVGLALVTSAPVAFVILVVAGGLSLAFISTLMTMLQVVLPAWIRGRGSAVYLLALQACFALGALVWGFVAEQVGISATFVIAAGALVVGAVVVTPLRLNRHMDRDTSAVPWLDPPQVTSLHDSDGPILVSARWEIAEENREGFVSAMNAVRRALKRQGALEFRLSEDVENPGQILESFTLATWAEYQRLPERSIAGDHHIYDAMIESAGVNPPALVVHRVIDTS